jgi:hypothetical protein
MLAGGMDLSHPVRACTVLQLPVQPSPRLCRPHTHALILCVESWAIAGDPGVGAGVVGWSICLQPPEEHCVAWRLGS